MTHMFRGLAWWAGAGAMVASAVAASAQSEQHGRKYKAPPPSAHVVVTVEKAFNGKPLENAAVIFQATRDGKTDAHLEVKTDPDGKAAIDLLDIGSHVTVQIIARGYATYATEFDLTTDTKELEVKMLRPRAQVSEYQDTDGKAADIKPGVQEHIVPKAGASGATGTTGAVAPPATSTPR